MSDSRPAVVGFAWGLLALAVATTGGALLLTPSGHRGAWLLFLLAFVFAVWSAFLFVALSREPGRRTTPVRRGRVATLHTLSFIVGDREKHSVDFVFDQMWGWLTISVDGRLIIRRFITFSVRLRRVFDFRVGTGERHDVRIEKTRPLLVAFARPQPTRAFCDGVLVAEDDGVS